MATYRNYSMGRPRVNKTIRVETDEEWLKFRSRAKDQDMNISEFLTELMDQYAHDEITVSRYSKKLRRTCPTKSVLIDQDVLERTEERAMNEGLKLGHVMYALVESAVSQSVEP